MKDSTISEISNLFQELIVSKIKDEIKLLIKEIDDVKESNESCKDKIEKLPKLSSIKRIIEGEQTEVIDLINKIAKDSKSEKYLKDIVAYLKKQYSFSDERTLCLVLDEIQQKNNLVYDEIIPIKTFAETNNIDNNLNSLASYIKEQCSFGEDNSLCCFLEHFSNTTEEKIDGIIANQESFVEKYDAIVAILGQYKESILAQISTNIESSEHIKGQLEDNQQVLRNNADSMATVIGLSNEGVERLNSIQESINSISQKTDNANIVLNNVLDKVGPESDILGLLRIINSNIENEEDNSESEWSIKKNLLGITKKIDELSKKNELQDEMISGFYEKYDSLEKSKNKKIKILVTGNIISAMGVIALILMQIF